MKKRLSYLPIVLLLALGIIICIGQTDVRAKKEEVYIEVQDTAVYSVSKAGGNLYGYNSLTEKEQAIFNKIGERMEGFIISELYKTDLSEESSVLHITLEIDKELDESTLEKIAYRFIYSNPKYYWLKKTCYVSEEDVGVYSVGMKVDPYYYEYVMRKDTDDAIYGVADSWAEEIKKEYQTSGSFYAGLLAHDLIVENTQFAGRTDLPESGLWANSIAGVFTGEGSTSIGYAKTFEYLLDLAGIENVYIVGTDNYAWNAVKDGDKWYLCDITMDDHNLTRDDGLSGTDYLWYFMPKTLFATKHTFKTDGTFYDLPEFSEDLEKSFYGRLKCYSDTLFTKSSGEAFAKQVIENRYKNCTFVYVVCPKNVSYSATDYVIPLLESKEYFPSTYQTDTPYGYLMRIPYVVIENPATSIELDVEEVELDLKGTVVITATTTPKDSDDWIFFSLSNFSSEEKYPVSRYAKISKINNKVTITGLKNGKVVLTAVAYSSIKTDTPVTKTCVITIGTGISSADAIVWQNGSKEYQKATLKTEIKANTWKDDKGKIKSGKLIWFASDTQIIPAFDETKHTVSFEGTKSKNGSVNAKGEFSAKNAGTVYVYACDTGSCSYEEIIVDILAAPSKMTLTKVPNSEDRKDQIKKLPIMVGGNEKVYISPFVKDGKASENCHYTVTVSKSDQKKYVSLSEVKMDDKDNPYFEIDVLDMDRSKAKTTSVKLDIICKESNKKATLTVVIFNPIVRVSLKDPSGSKDLTEKSNSITYKVDYETIIGGYNVTTDKIKVYVGMESVTLEEGRVVCDKGATVKAKFNQKEKKLTLTATKEAGTPALIYMALTNSADKKDVILIQLAKVNVDGTVTI